MAFTRRFLTALGIEAEKIDEIINAHTEVTDALKEQRDQYKADAEKLPEVQKELDDLKESIDGNDSFKKKYDDLKEEYDKFKDDLKSKETLESKSKAYGELLKEAGVPEKRIDAILRVTDLTTVELNKDGSVKDSEKVKESITKEWSEFIPTTGTKGADTITPPANTGGKKSKEEILAIKDTAERQQAMLENKDLFL
jgi:DNA-binding transcriptional MerR regulator